VVPGARSNAASREHRVVAAGVGRVFCGEHVDLCARLAQIVADPLGDARGAAGLGGIDDQCLHHESLLGAAPDQKMSNSCSIDTSVMTSFGVPIKPLIIPRWQRDCSLEGHEKHTANSGVPRET
jgi:hypothetical protein